MAKTPRFSDRDLLFLILPIITERLLSMLIGITDTIMISYAGETAVAGISLVNQINNVFIFIFGALSTGGAVIASQYIGCGDRERSITAASQLMMFTALVSIVLMMCIMLFRLSLMNLSFGRIEDGVRTAADTYMIFTALSFPALAIFNSSAALFRSMSKSGVILVISLIMNIINIAGNAIGIFTLNAGITGIAVSSIISRLFAATVTLVVLSKKGNDISIGIKEIFSWNAEMLKRILGIAVPSGIETGLFQISKVALAGIVALFGTVQIAANAVAQNFWSMETLFCTAMGYVFVTVIGQCMGEGNAGEAGYYFKKLLHITYIGSIVWNIMILAATSTVLPFYNLSEETKQLVIILVVMLAAFNAVLCPLDFSLPNGLRAAGDARYTMYSSVFATVICRVVFSVLFGVWLNMGVIGIGLAIIGDRLIKGALIFTRYKSNKWMAYKLI